MAKKKKPAKKVVAKSSKPKAMAKKSAKKEPVKAVAKKAKKVAAKPATKPAKAKKAAKPAPAPKPSAAKAKPVEEKKSKRAVSEPPPAFDVVEESDDFGDEAVAEAPAEVKMTESDVDEVVLTDAEGRRYCRLRDCDQVAMVDGYCRYHYLLFWKKIQVRKKILAEGKLERYIEELTSRYPDKYLEILKKDLKTEKDFLAAIQELEIDESGGDGEFEDETQSYIDEVRGMSETGAAREEEEF